MNELWTIQLFGGLCCRSEDREIARFPAQQPGALLALLALHLPRSLAREEVMEWMWPDEAPETAQHKLRNCLHTLRRHLAQLPADAKDLLLTTRTTIGLDPERVHTDVAAFETALRAASRATDRTERAQQLDQAVRLYRGDLLPGFYQDGFLREKERLADLFRSALLTLAQAQEQAGDFDQAMEAARRAVALDPLMEEAHVAVMRLHAALGQPSGVLKQFEEWERVLREELGEEPSQTTRVVMETLRRTAQEKISAKGNGESTGEPSIATEQAVPGVSPATPKAVSLPSRASAKGNGSAPLPNTLAAPSRTPRHAGRTARRLLWLVPVVALLGLSSYRGRQHKHAMPRSGLPLTSWRLAFWRVYQGRTGIWVMNTDGTGLKQLTNNPLEDILPSWSPDGKRIVFLSWRNGNSEVYVMQADGTEPKRLTYTSEGENHPSFSPDGKHIVFVSRRDASAQIYVMDANGSHQTRLTDDDSDNEDPCWSPDGREIAFTSNRQGRSNLYVMNVFSKKLRQITNDDPDNTDPSWSPDGSQIAFTSNRTGTHHIYVMNADGSDIVPLTRGAIDSQAPRWSPDGRYIAFRSRRAGPQDLYVMNADGTEQRRLTHNANGREPTWCPVPRLPTR